MLPLQFDAVGLALAVQLVALTLDQLIVTEVPWLIAMGMTARDTVGILPTVTVTEEEPDPPVALKQVSVKLVLALRAPVDSIPESARSPLQEPAAAQLTAFVLAQLSVEDCPDSTVVGFAERVTLGRGLTATVAETGAEDPPDPVQTSV